MSEAEQTSRLSIHNKFVKFNKKQCHRALTLFYLDVKGVRKKKPAKNCLTDNRDG